MVAACPAKQLGVAVVLFCCAHVFLPAQGLPLHTPGDGRPLLLLDDSVPSGGGGVVDDATNPFTITVNVGSGFTAEQAALFQDAADTWQSHLVAYHPSIANAPGGITIDASAVGIDGASGTLAQAGPTSGVIRSWDRGYDVFLATNGEMTFDTADLPSMTLLELSNVIVHEMAHVLGFGTLWDTDALGGAFAGTQDLIDPGVGEYNGASGVARWALEFSPGATHVPVELGGGSGTADAHWDEVDGGNVLTGITDSAGNDFRNELMTGWLDSPTFISETTIASFEDLGFVVVMPEPSLPLLVALSALTGGLRRRRHHRNECLFPKTSGQ